VRLSPEQIAAGLEAFGYAVKLCKGLPGDAVRLVLFEDAPIEFVLTIGSQRLLLEWWDGERFHVEIEGEVLWPVLAWLQDTGFPVRKAGQRPLIPVK
jgi:hypothetical protein